MTKLCNLVEVEGVAQLARVTGLWPLGSWVQIPSLSPHITMLSAPVAQLDRAPDFESVGRRFESCRACQLNQLLSHVT